jgi:predicted cupin superfamily sugar epimerase
MRKNLKWIGLALLAIVVLVVAVLAFFPPQFGTIPAVTQTQQITLPDNLRNYRYCEVIPVFQWGVKLNAEVYNTLGANECPADLWAKLESTGAKALAKQYGAAQVELNGPRYWVVNKITASGATATGKTADFGGIEMTQRATLSFYLWSANAPGNYAANTVNRTNVYYYWAGNPIYELISPQGSTYIMQTYAQIVNASLSINDLATLVSQLTLPQGWKYQTCTLSAEFDLVTNGQATVIQDNLQNSYQELFTNVAPPTCQ